MKFKFTLFSVLSLMFSTFNLSAIEPNPNFGTITKITGHAQIQSIKDDKWYPAKLNSLLYPGDTLVTTATGETTILFSYEDEIKLKPGTVTKITSLGSDIKTQVYLTRISLLTGKAKFKVAKKITDSKFEVITPVIVCAVRGTEFDVDLNNETTVVRVYTGSVAIQDQTNQWQEIILQPGQEIAVQPEKIPGKPEPIKPISEVQTAAKPVKKSTPAPAAPVPVIDTGTKEPPKSTTPDSSTTGTDTTGAAGTKGSSGAPQLNMNGNFGTVVLADNQGNKKIYTQLSLKPELSLWKFGVGLDIYIYIDENNNFKYDEWNSWDDVLTKIWYIRFGHRGEPVYVYLGGFPGVTLGHGLIVDRYSNMLLYPNVRQVGAEVGLDFGTFGVELLTGNVNRTDIYGGRVYFRPLFRTGIPLIRNLGIGISAATDQNPLPHNEGDQVTVYGADLDLPVVNNTIISMLVYADVAQINLGTYYQGIKNGGLGFAGGFRGKLIGLIDYRAEYRKLENSFIPGYFGPFYDAERAAKVEKLPRSNAPVDIKEGPIASLGANILGLVNTSVTYEDYTVDPNEFYPYIHAELNVDPALFKGKFIFKATYDKRNVNSWKDLTEIKGQNAIISTEFGYPVSGNIYLIVINRQTFDPLGNPINTTSLETRIKF